MLQICRLIAEKSQHPSDQLAARKRPEIEFYRFDSHAFLQRFADVRVHRAKEQRGALASGFRYSVSARVDPQPIVELDGQAFGHAEGDAIGQQQRVDDFLLVSWPIFC